MKTIDVVLKSSTSLKKETLNLIDSLTHDEILDIETATNITKIIELLGDDNALHLGEGIFIKLCEK